MSDDEGPDAPEASAGVLGETEHTFDVEDRDTLRVLSLAMAQQCRGNLSIVSRHLDPPVYDTDEFADAVKTLALSHRRASIRLLVIDSRPLITSGHRVIELSTRLTSFIEVRAPARQHRTFNEAVLLADTYGYVHRQFSDRFEGTASFNDKRVVSQLTDRFDEMWERAVPDTNFRRLHL